MKLSNRINQWLANYLTYNRAEQRGIFVLCLLLLSLIIFQALIPAETLQPAPDFRAFSAEVEAFEKEWRRAADSDSMARVDRYRHYRKNTGSYHHDSGSQPAKYHKPLLQVDLNVADTFALQQLRGIGPAFAKRIVAYRGRLRGFYDKRQLLEVFGMDSTRYFTIEENLQVTPDSVHPIDLNTVTFKELLRHPYFPFAVTKNIMIYRQKNKAFRNLEELKRVEGVNDSLFRRMVIYLRLGP